MSDSAIHILCRRCGHGYVYAASTILTACPHCGASPRPLRHHLRHNGTAAALAVVALIVLIIGMALPFISMTKLGASRIFSLIGGIIELFHSGNIFIATILLLFSVIFPIVKLLMILGATSSLVRLSDRTRKRMHKIAVVTGKYSLLDLVVAAVTIVVVKFGEFAEVRAQPGTILFCVAILLSIAAGLCVKFDDATVTEEATPTPPRSRPYLRLLWLVPALAMLGVGLYFYYNVEPGGEVDALKLTTRHDMVGQAAEAVANIDPSTPDLYLKLFTTAAPIDLPIRKDTPIGNGLTWNLPKPLPLRDVQRVEVWDHRTILKDKYLDRITLDGWSTDGQRFHVDLLGKRNEPPKWALPVAAVGGALTLIVLLRFVWDQVI